MSFEMMFLTAVLGIALIHLLFGMVNTLGSMIGKRSSVNIGKKERSDWYVFFKVSDLCGVKEVDVTKQKNECGGGESLPCI